MDNERMLKYFTTDYGGLMSEFKACAEFLCEKCPPSPERTVALRKLLEAQDAAIRASNE